MTNKTFSELRMLESETGLKFDTAPFALVGEKDGYPVEIFDNGAAGEYLFVVYAAFGDGDTAYGAVDELTQNMPKNSVISRHIYNNRVEIHLKKTLLLQENLIYIEELVNAFAPRMIDEGIAAGTLDSSLRPNNAALKKAAGKKTAGSLPKTLLGALIGSIIGGIIFIILLHVSGFISFIGAAAIGFFAVFFAKKLGKRLTAAGTVITSAVIAVSAFGFSHFSMMIDLYASVNAANPAENISIFGIFAGYSEYIAAYPTLISDFINHLIIAFVFAAFTAGAMFIRYFNHHSDEMYR